MTTYGEQQAYRPFSTGCMALLLLGGFVVMGVRACTDCVGITEPAPAEADAADAADTAPAQEGPYGPGFAEPAPAGEAVDTHCGSDRASPPASVNAAAWSSYRCLDRHAAGARWPDCLRRTDYAAAAGGGCPGASGSAAEQRCCPPHDDGW